MAGLRKPDSAHNHLMHSERPKSYAMKIIGIGIDLVKISRMEAIIRRWRENFLDKIFTHSEQQDCLARKAPHLHLSGRFAVKEALLKALGTGMRNGMRWKEMEIRRDSLGKPVLHLNGRTRQLAEEKGVSEILTSITHDHDYAIGQVILQGVERR